MKIIGGFLAVCLLVTGCSSGSDDQPSRLEVAYKQCKKDLPRAEMEKVQVDSDGKGISMSAGGVSQQAEVTGMACVLRRVHTPRSLLDRITSTQGGGELTASRDGLDYSWAYRPGSGGFHMTITESGS